ncbi:MAG TPA: polysaccharide biosynthesis/export family protein [Opitutus sp.]|nr:polysaccharide biosynthesis/export family protein [Opitutus sp.]
MFRPTLRLFLIATLFAGSFASAARADDAAPKDDKSAFIYRLTVTDQVRISIFQEDDLAEVARIDARGNINLKLVGDLHVAGLTVNEAQHAIEQAYIDGRYLRSPQATVSIEEYAPREVSIQGQVKAPGRYLLPIESTFSIVELVTKAGGLTDIAKGSSVIVTRVLPDGTKKTYTVDVESIIRGKNTSSQAHSLLLEAGDIVYVPERII